MTRPAQQITATILGCGSSAGVPRIGNNWGVCDPNNPRNRRRRCALLITGTSEGAEAPTQILIDTGCDLREQLLGAHVQDLNAVFYTHEHADHTHGIDDLRVLALNSQGRVDVYYGQRTGERLNAAFGYCFKSAPESGYPPILDGHVISDGQTIAVDGPGGVIELTAFEQVHGDITSFGYRVGRFAYSVDLSAIPQSSLDHVKDLDVWVLDALRPRPHPSHLNLEQALGWIERMQPKQAVLSNLHVDFDHDALNADTADNIRPAFDGLQIDVTNGRVLD